MRIVALLDNYCKSFYAHFEVLNDFIMLIIYIKLPLSFTYNDL